MSNTKLKITLADFQNRKFEIRKEDFIYYINNPNFYSRWENVLYSTVKIRLLYYLKHKLPRLLKTASFKNNIFLLGFGKKSINSEEYIKDILNSSGKLKRQNIIVVLGKGDYEITDEFADEVPNNIKLIYANNINTENPRFRYLPMGRDFRSSALFSKIKPTYKKDCLCYCNYSISTHSQREELYNSIKDKQFIEFEHMGKFLDYSMSRRDFYNKVSKSKFTICPRGNGIDTFRFWDSIYLGAIPIVVKEAVFHDYLYDLPILFLDSYEDFAKLNRKFLEENYQNMLRKKYNYNKLLLSYWINEIESC